MSPAAAIVECISARCAEHGLDLSASCAAEDYDAEVAPEHRLPDVGRRRALAIVIGNTRALWPHVRDAVAAGESHSVDEHVARVVGRAVDEAVVKFAPQTRFEIRFAHEAPPRRIAIQRLAHVARLAYLAPSHLCVHPTFGPWMALRAAIVIDVEGPSRLPQLQRPCDCASGCQPALQRAIAAGPPRDEKELRQRWELWLAVRDACPVGRAHRYSDEQIRYHYAGQHPALEPVR
jgi:methylmalonic aciduria homocystinuria type C protein